MSLVIYISHESTLFNAHSYFLPAVRHNERIFQQIHDLEVVYSVNDQLVNAINKEKGPCTKVIPVRQLEDTDVELFRRCYQHFSPNPPWFEIACFLRYFRARSILKSTGRRAIAIADSDNLFFPEVALLNRLDLNFTYLNTGITTAHIAPSATANRAQASGGLMIFEINELERFCGLILSYYQNESLLGTLICELESDAGICDMTFLSLISASARDLNSYLKNMDIEYDIGMGALSGMDDRRLDVGVRLFSTLDDRQPFPSGCRLEGTAGESFRALINIQFNADSKSLLWGVTLLYSLFKRFKVQFPEPFLSVVSMFCNLSILRASVYQRLSSILSNLKRLIA